MQAWLCLVSGVSTWSRDTRAEGITRQPHIIGHTWWCPGCIWGADVSDLVAALLIIDHDGCLCLGPRWGMMRRCRHCDDQAPGIKWNIARAAIWNNYRFLLRLHDTGLSSIKHRSQSVICSRDDQGSWSFMKGAIKSNVIILRCVDTMYILITFYTHGLDTIREGCRRLRGLLPRSKQSRGMIQRPLIEGCFASLT